MIAKNSVRLLALLLLFACQGAAQKDGGSSDEVAPTYAEEVEIEEFFPQPAAEDPSAYLDQLRGKRIAIVANHTSYVGEKHLVDTLLASGIEIAHVYAPEHGFRGDQDAGAHIHDEQDKKTGLQIYSLHGKTKKPSAESLSDVDLVLFDIQDVGVRFYTYISTLHYVMEACAEQGIPVMVLDRPNPNLVARPDGPLLDMAYSSFVGMHPVPVLYGLTIGEYGQMINGEGWLADGLQAELTVIPCQHYYRDSEYELPIAPSPNLPNQNSIYLYPSLCFFEGSEVSVGRGTDRPFQVVGHPNYGLGSYGFTPMPNAASKYPKLEGEQCFGLALSPERGALIRESQQLDLSFLLDFYQALDHGEEFFSNAKHFDLIAGSDALRQQMLAGKSAEEIRASWQEDLAAYDAMWRKYWIYSEE